VARERFLCALRRERGTTEDRGFLLAAIIARLSFGSQIVITHGTDTIFETASYLETDLPVICLITCINKSGEFRSNPHRSISNFGWVEDGTGKRGKSSRLQIYNWIKNQNGQAYVIDRQVHKASVHPREMPTGPNIYKPSPINGEGRIGSNAPNRAHPVQTRSWQESGVVYKPEDNIRDVASRSNVITTTFPQSFSEGELQGPFLSTLETTYR
jgi:hypothetical protein